MAAVSRTSLTRNLRLKVSSDLTADSRYNLERIDTLAGLIQTNTDSDTVIRSLGDIHLLPNSADIGGTGVGGAVTFGSPDQYLSSVTFYTDSVSFTSSLLLEDTAVGGTTSLLLRYKSDILGSLDSTNRTLSLDLEGSSRSLVLGGDISLIGNISLTSPLGTSWTLPSTSGTSGQVLSTDGTGVLSWTSTGGGGSALSSLSDVQFAGLTSSDLLRFNGSKWENKKMYQSFSWAPADGLSKTVSHSLGTTNVLVQIKDENGYFIDLGIQVFDSSTVILTSSNTPTGTWIILIYSLI